LSSDGSVETSNPALKAGINVFGLSSKRPAAPIGGRGADDPASPVAPDKAVIISLHVPKTGGETFKAALEAAFGPRMLTDYGDMVGFASEDILVQRTKRAMALLAKRDEIERDHDIVHGHFIADKYRGLFRTVQYAAFFRHPTQQTLSLYKYLRRIPLRKNPTIRAAQDPGVSFVDFLQGQTVTNSQAEVVGSVPLTAFAMIGLAEEYERSVALFNATFGCNVQVAAPVNVDPDTQGRGHVLTPDEKRAVRLYRQADFEAYREAKGIFHRLCAARGL
jgi:hypothetical protein